jgi:spore coat polysaccharide biosynthesis protein SpsF (cytidylyltransferase family)
MSFNCLLEAHREAILPSHREHVTPFIKLNPARYRVGNVSSDVDYSGLRWTVDEMADFMFVSETFKELYPGNPEFGMEDVLRLISRKPELVRLNSHLRRNEGSAKSLAADAEFLRNSENE